MAGRRGSRITTGAVVQHVGSILCAFIGLALVGRGFERVGFGLFAIGVVGLLVSRFLVQAVRHNLDHLSKVDLEESAEEIAREIEAAKAKQRTRR